MKNHEVENNSKLLENIKEESGITSSEESEYGTEEEEMYQQMGLIKLKDMEIIPINEVRRRVDKIVGKNVLDFNEVDEEITPIMLEETNEANRSYYRKYEEGSCSYRRPNVKPKEFLEKTAR